MAALPLFLVCIVLPFLCPWSKMMLSFWRLLWRASAKRRLLFFGEDWVASGDTTIVVVAMPAPWHKDTGTRWIFDKHKKSTWSQAVPTKTVLTEATYLNEAILLLLYKHILRYASSGISRAKIRNFKKNCFFLHSNFWFWSLIIYEGCTRTHNGKFKQSLTKNCRPETPNG